jgi:hypothetical protein
MGMRTLWIVALLACSGFAAEAKISGPATAKTGDLVVINASESTGKAFKWVMPEGLATLSCSELEFGFASGTPGVYTFTLVAADTEGDGDKISVASHTVRVGGVVVVPDPDPKPDPEEPNPPPSNLDELRELSKESAAKLADSITARGLSEAIQTEASRIAKMCEQGQCPTLDGAKRLMVQSIENRLLMRAGASRNVAWSSGWREPINAALKVNPATTVEAYLAAMRAVAVGLSES